MKLFASLRRTWKRHDERLAETAYRDEADVERLKDLNDRLEAMEIVGKLYGVAGSDLGMSEAIREEDAREKVHPRDEAE